VPENTTRLFLFSNSHFTREATAGYYSFISTKYPVTRPTESKPIFSVYKLCRAVLFVLQILPTSVYQKVLGHFNGQKLVLVAKETTKRVQCKLSARLHGS